MPEVTDKDACDVLDADHIAVKHLFVEYARLATEPRTKASSDRVAIARQICEELTVHAKIEEEIFYPALRRAVPKASGLLAEAQAEHQQAKELIAQLQSMPAADDAMDALVAQLNRAVEHHVKEERDELFPKARSAPGLDLVALAQQLRGRQEELKPPA